jgi:LDH2 family malate/lactate/ureidoglycolate dehydrogenase
MDRLVERVHQSPTGHGFTEVVMPGELEARLEAERRGQGVPYHRKEFAALAAEAASAGLPPLPVLQAE